MSSWQPFTLAMIPGVPPALDAVGQATGMLTGLLDTLAGLLNTLAQLLQFLSDVISAAIAALCALIQEIIDQIFNLLNTGIYFYLDKGPFFTGAAPDGLEGFLSRWRGSFQDLGDKSRPVFAGNANVSAMLFLVGANDLPSLQKLLALLGLLFGIPSLSWEDDLYTFDVPSIIEAGMSTPPDWRSVRLGEVIPPFQRLGEMLMAALGMIKIADGYSGMLAALAQVIAEKAAVLSAIADEIQKLVDEITALIESAGLYILSVDGDSLDGLISNASTAGNEPPWNLESYVAGVCLLAGTADFGPVVELLGG